MTFKNEFQRAVDNTVAKLQSERKKAVKARPVPFRSKPDPVQDAYKALGLDQARIRRAAMREE